MKIKTIRECLEEQTALNKSLIDGMNALSENLEALRKRIDDLEGRKTERKKPGNRNDIGHIFVKLIRW